MEPNELTAFKAECGRIMYRAKLVQAVVGDTNLPEERIKGIRLELIQIRHHLTNLFREMDVVEE